jgi:hypothetical protein
MAASPKVGIIVLNYNGKDCLLACLESLSGLEYPNWEGIVVDNASSDGSLLAAEKAFPQLTFVRNAKNEGFAKGMNVGIQQALARGAEWCWIVNYDTKIDPAALACLVAAAGRHPQAGLLSPIIYEERNTRPWFAKGHINFLRMRALHSDPDKRELASESYSSEFLTGCALLIKKELIETIGFLDERFFLYYEDADYSLRATQAGFSCLVVPGAQVWHAEVSRTRPEKIYFLVYSGLLFFEKHASFFSRPYFWAYVTIRRAKNAFDVAFRKSVAASEVRRAYEHFFHEH